LDDARAAFHRCDIVEVRGRLAARRTNLLDHSRRDALIGASADGATAEIVDDDLRAFMRKQDRLGTSDATSSAGHDRDLPR
jgi:hypothetical protein